VTSIKHSFVKLIKEGKKCLSGLGKQQSKITAVNPRWLYSQAKAGPDLKTDEKAMVTKMG
jgi:hypothetical protein